MTDIDDNTLLEEKELYNYEDTEFRGKCYKVLRDISDIFRKFGFTDKYREYCYNNITKTEVCDYIKSVLLDLDEYTRHDLNYMWAMLSDKNCWHVEYDVAVLIHEELMKIWYPKDYKVGGDK